MDLARRRQGSVVRCKENARTGHGGGRCGLLGGVKERELVDTG
jgi:hypothetical protein